MRRAAIFLAAGALVAYTAGCGPRAASRAEPQASEADRAGFLQEPEIIAVVRGAAGGAVVQGRARPLGRVRAILPSNEAYGATADDQGRFALDLPPSPDGQLVTVSAQEGTRSVPAEGWLFLAPGDGGSAAVLRAGAASLNLSPQSGLIGAADFDGSGGAAVSGRAVAGADVRISLDGAQLGQVRADARGHYVLRIDRVAAGSHRLRVASQGQAQERTVDFGAPIPPTSRFTAARLADAWRVDWRIPGGGVQTTLVFVPGARP